MTLDRRDWISLYILWNFSCRMSSRASLNIVTIPVATGFFHGRIHLPGDDVFSFLTWAFRMTTPMIDICTIISSSCQLSGSCLAPSFNTTTNAKNDMCLLASGPVFSNDGSWETHNTTSGLPLMDSRQDSNVSSGSSSFSRRLFFQVLVGSQ